MPDAARRAQSLRGLLLALVLAGIGAVALGMGLHGQARLDLAYTEARLAARFRPLLVARDEGAVRRQVRALQTDARLALSFLAVRDASGRVLASGGAFESWPLRWVPAVQRASVRRQVYRVTSDHGLAVMADDAAQPLGTVEFSRFRQLRAEVDAAALVTLRRVGISLLVVAGGLLVGLAWRQRRPAARPDPDVLRARLRGQSEAAGAPAGAPEAESPSAFALLAALQVAALRFDPEGRVRAMNAPAERWTGWRARDAQSRPLLSVLKLQDASGESVLGTAHGLLADPLPERLQQPLTLLSRKGERQRVDLTVLAETRGGREGGIVLLTDAGPRLDAVAELQAEAGVMREALGHLDEAILLVNRDGSVRTAHGRADALFGYVGAEWPGLTLAKLFPVPFVQTPELSLVAFESVQGDRPPVRAWRKDAQSFPVTLRAHLLGEGRGWMVQVRDLSEAGHVQRRAQRERRWFELGVDQAFVLDAQTLSFIEVSAAAKAALGYPPARWAHLSLPGIAPELDRTAFQAWLRALREGQVEVVHYTTRHRSADGAWLPVRVALQYLDDAVRPVFLATAMRLDA